MNTFIQANYKFYNYIYLDPRKPGQYCYEGLNFSFLYEPFYVGKGCNGRKYDHISYTIDKHNTYKSGKIIHILEEGHDLKEYILQINSKLNNQQSKDIEINLIARIGRKDLGLGPLTNLTDGGDGNSNPGPEFRKKCVERMKHFKHTEESKEKIRNSKIGKKRQFTQEWMDNLSKVKKGKPQTGGVKYHSEETKKNMSENRKGEKNSNYGNKYNHTEESKRKMSENAKPNYTFYKITDSNNNIYVIKGRKLLQEFCNNQNINLNTLLNHINQGLILFNSHHFANNSCVGWTIEISK